MKSMKEGEKGLEADNGCPAGGIARPVRALFFKAIGAWASLAQ